MTKPKSSLDNTGRSASTSGIKRPHSPASSQPRNPIPPNTAALLNSMASRGGAFGGGADGQSNLEARLAALEAMLGDVPPKVHNAFLSSLDARLGSGTGVGLKEGKGEGVGVALEALSGGNLAQSLLTNFGLEDNMTGSSGANSWQNTSSGSANAFTGPSSTLAPDWNAYFANAMNQGQNGQKSRNNADLGVNEMAKRMEGMSFFYEDEIGQAKWQGATSGFPLLDLLTAANAVPEQETETLAAVDPPDPFASPSTIDTPPDLDATRRQSSSQSVSMGTVRGMGQNSFNSNMGASGSGRTASRSPPIGRKSRFFPDRTPRPHQTLNPEASWKVITGVIPPDLMDTLVRCYLSTSHLLWPFLHVPSFLQDYANPAQWGEPGFACFIVAVCTLSSRHVDDPRVRANPQDPSTAGKAYFELFKRLRDLPSADRPTLYSIQAAFLAAIYAFGLGNLSKAFALQAESITLCLDGGLHRSVDAYDHFDAVERETRKVSGL